MRVMSAKELEDEFGLAHDLLDELERDAAAGVLHGEPRGEVVMGRPLMFGEKMAQVGFKEPLGKIGSIDARAKQLGLKRSDYLRRLVDEDLRMAGMNA